MDNKGAKELLQASGLRVTPQRLIVVEALFNLRNHPTADQVAEYVRKVHPSVATGTVYNVLDTLVEKGLIAKVKTDQGLMRYDAMQEKHHHLYCEESDQIRDYFDEELDSLLDDYFRRKSISDFKIEDIRLQIIGKFKP